LVKAPDLEKVAEIDADELALHGPCELVIAAEIAVVVER
jgi:hypothetical protein